jgi:GTPase SAR1 family protein
MTFDISSLKQSSSGSPRILLYGSPGAGKTTFASQFPSPIFLDLERGIPPHAENVTVYEPDGKTDKPNHDPRHVKYKQVYEFLQWVSDGDHEFKTLVIDSLDRLEELVTDHILVENGWKFINEPGFGKGQDAVFRRFRDLLDIIDNINEKGITTIMIAHAGSVKVEHPVYPPYDKIGLLLMKKVGQWFIENSDLIGYCSMKTYVTTEKLDRLSTRNKALSTGERILTTGPSAILETKNRRYEKLPDEIPLSYKTFLQYAS